ncbi:fumarylacetoacetate hydrolase family protein [Gammaproteobacteria bacterium]|nr:fumarylacetoacetate hydrolase family protein [Gammaproteobacteria bacterium]
MKLLSYQNANGHSHLGALQHDRIINLHRASDAALPDNMLEFLQLGALAMETARLLLATQEGDVALDSVKLLAPIVNPQKVVAIGLNYMDHVREAGFEVPEFATMFCKYPSSIIASDDDIKWSQQLTQQVDYEAELALVIGKTARGVAASDAYEYIAGYMNCNDVSARDLQLRPGDQWLRGKCLDSFCPLGPWLVCSDEIRDPHALSIQCRVNGELRQDSNTSEIIHQIPQLIEYLSAAFTLLPGDVIITGTPHGVGAFRNPPLWLKQDDVVEVEIEGLGVLRNRCRPEDQS